MPTEDSSLCYGFKLYYALYKVELRSREPEKGVAFNSLICWRRKKVQFSQMQLLFFPVRKIMYLATEKILLK